MRFFYATVFLYLALHFFTGCTTFEKAPGVSLPGASPTPTPKPGETIVVELPEDLPKLPGMKPEWTFELFKALLAQLPHLEKASDLERFCPNYKKLAPDEKLVFWGHFSAAIIRFESGFQKDAQGKSTGFFKTCSSMTESNGVDSIGFFQMSYGDNYEGCPESKAEGNLCDPNVGIRCGVSAMGKLISRDKIIAAGGYVKFGAPPCKGAACYWSVLRVEDSNSPHHLAEIIELSKKAPGCS